MALQTLMDKLDFGEESAESEQQFLQRVFLPTPFFDRIRRGQKQLVLGRKGSGKTAVCLRLFDDLNRQGARVSLITPRDLSRFRISMLEKGCLNSSESSLLSWKYVFFVELSLYILEAARKAYGDNYLLWPDGVKQVREFLVDNVSSQANWVDKTFRVISTIRKLGLKLFEVGLELESNVQDQEVAEFADILDSITNPISSEVAALIKEPIYLLVDKVDEIWAPGEESDSLVVGLLRASKEIWEEIDSVNVVVFLRSDIYDSLKFHDSDKFHSVEERIIWGKSDLKKLVALRARASSGIGMRRDAYDEVWRRFFPEKVNGVDSFEYLLEHTLMRPRDLIQLCNLCRDKTQDNGHKTIMAEDILEALPQYSRWKLKDLRDEYQVQYPFLERVFLGVFQHATPQLNKEDVSQRIALVKDHLIQEFGSLYFDHLDNLLQILYNIGFLGAIKDTKALYNHLGDNVVIPYISEFEIHQAFRLALETRVRKWEFWDPGPIHVIGSDNVVIGARSTTAGISAVAVSGDVSPGSIYRQAEMEVLRVVQCFRGQTIPGHLLNVDGEFTLPTFSKVDQRHRIPEAGIELDILAESEDGQWAIEIKNRRLRPSDLHQLVSYGLAANAQAWIVSFTAITEDIKVISKNLEVLVTGAEEWNELKKLVEL